jgi:hypothetical protein
MTPWHLDALQFFAYLRARGWRYPLLVFGNEVQAFHFGKAPRARNDNRATLS